MYDPFSLNSHRRRLHIHCFIFRLPTSLCWFWLLIYMCYSLFRFHFFCSGKHDSIIKLKRWEIIIFRFFISLFLGRKKKWTWKDRLNMSISLELARINVSCACNEHTDTQEHSSAQEWYRLKWSRKLSEEMQTRTKLPRNAEVWVRESMWTRKHKDIFQMGNMKKSFLDEFEQIRASKRENFIVCDVFSSPSPPSLLYGAFISDEITINRAKIIN